MGETVPIPEFLSAEITGRPRRLPPAEERRPPLSRGRGGAGVRELLEKDPPAPRRQAAPQPWRLRAPVSAPLVSGALTIPGKRNVSAARGAPEAINIETCV